MLIGVKSMSIQGVDGYLVDVQVDVSNGMPNWEVVGLPDTSVRESKERVRAAIKNSDYYLPSRKIVINLAPAYTKKEGSFFDLPIAIGILYDIGIIKTSEINDFVFIGELSLNGNLNKINGILPMCIEALKLGIKNIIIPFENRLEAGVLNGLNIYPAKNLIDVVNHLNHHKIIPLFSTNINSISFNNSPYQIDFSEIKGQESAKRALEIAAAGAHNCLLIGSPRFRKNNAFKKTSLNSPRLNF